MQHPAFVEAFRERHQWGADPVTVNAGHGVDPLQITGGVLHHAAWAMQDYDRDGFLHGDVDDTDRYMRRMQTIRPDLGLEVPYSAVVFPGTQPATCIIAVGRGKGRTGAHTAGLNSTRYGICVPGNTDTDSPITPGQLLGFRYVMALWAPHATAPTIGHRQAPPYISRGTNLNATGCPGDNGISHLPALQPPFHIIEEDPDVHVKDLLLRDARPGRKGATYLTSVFVNADGSTRGSHVGTLLPDGETVTFWRGLGIEMRDASPQELATLGVLTENARDLAL